MFWKYISIVCARSQFNGVSNSTSLLELIGWEADEKYQVIKLCATEQQYTAEWMNYL